MTGQKPFAVVSTQVYAPDGPRPAAILIQDGSILAVSPPRETPSGWQVVDFKDTPILPGLVDTHVHVNEPGRSEWEGFLTATQAAAAGGITSLLDMPLNSIPVTTSTAAFSQKIEAARGKLWIDCGFTGGLIPGNAGEIEGLAKAGVFAFKAFMIHSGIDEFPACKEEDLRRAMTILERLKLPILVHAELCRNGEDETTLSNPRRYEHFLASRPSRWENDAIALILALCRETSCRVHIVHLSSAEALPILSKAKKEGLPVTVETCPHYLSFEAESIPDGSTLHKCCPPIRGAENRAALWNALKEGVIDMIVSDHSPSSVELKSLKTGDFGSAWGGIASLQFSLPAVWTEARRAGLPLERTAEWMSAAPARHLGLAKKGAIRPGMDADLTVFDPNGETAVESAIILHRHKRTPYEGRRLAGKVLRTYLRGQIAFSNGAISSAPLGRFLLNPAPQEAKT